MDTTPRVLAAGSVFCICVCLISAFNAVTPWTFLHTLPHPLIDKITRSLL